MAADGHAAGFVVGGYENEGFVGVLEVKFVGLTEHVVVGKDFAHDCGAIIVMAGPVDVAPFNHEEEAVGGGGGQVIDGGIGELAEGVAFWPIDCVAHVLLNGIGVEQQEFGGTVGRKVFNAAHDGNTLVGEFFIEAGVFAFGHCAA